MIMSVCCRSGGLPNINGMFQSLRTFNVSGNAFTGAIPTRFGTTGIFSKARFRRFDLACVLLLISCGSCHTHA